METRKLYVQIYTDIIRCRNDALIRKHFNPLKPGGNKKVVHTWLLLAAGLYVCMCVLLLLPRLI